MLKVNCLLPTIGKGNGIATYFTWCKSIHHSLCLLLQLLLTLFMLSIWLWSFYEILWWEKFRYPLWVSLDWMRKGKEVVSCECVWVVWPISNGVKSAWTFLKIARPVLGEILSLVKYQPSQQITKLNWNWQQPQRQREGLNLNIKLSCEVNQNSKRWI